MVARNEGASGCLVADPQLKGPGRQAWGVAKFVIGIIVGIVIVLFVIVQCTQALF